jgi:hypothetical protein
MDFKSFGYSLKINCALFDVAGPPDNAGSTLNRGRASFPYRTVLAEESR